MKLHIKASEGFRLNLWLPTSLLKSKFVITHIKKHVAGIEPLMNTLPLVYKALEKHIKKNGHFVLIDIESSNGDKFFIKV